jgi:predicted ATPase
MEPFIKTITLQNFLSFGATPQTLELRPLNVLIGANGSGKSNFLEAFELLRSTPDDLMRPIREGGGTREWLWKGVKETPVATISLALPNPKGRLDLAYALSFTATGQRFELADERVENAHPYPGKEHPLYFYQFNRGQPLLKPGKNLRPDENPGKPIKPEDFDFDRSILAQRRDPERYPVITYLGDAFASIRLYREWSFGRDTAPRKPQSTDLPNVHLEKDCSNLAMVLNNLRRTLPVKQALQQAMAKLYHGFEDYEVILEGGTAQLFLQENKKFQAIPATRLSDGTLRFMCLLAVLLHPSPPPLICLEEPELGLHPDIIPTIAELLRDAATRTQLIVTTHSDILVDAMTENPESVVVVERHEHGTIMRRLAQGEIEPFLEQYRLGALWLSGQIGGTRW